MKQLITYAQNREDIILSIFFPDIKEGFYVDVGAYDPLYDSVTQYFYERGWSGINIEANSELIKSFNKLRLRDINLDVGVSDHSGTLTFREYKNKGLSTFSELTMREREKETPQPHKDIKKKVVTLAEVFAEHKPEIIHFLKVDVEGYEYEVLSGNDWRKYRPEVLCIEANHMLKNWRPLLRRKKYKFIHSDGLNEYYVDKNKKNRMSYFRIEKAFEAAIIHYKALEKIQKLNSEYRRLQKKCRELKISSYE